MPEGYDTDVVRIIVPAAQRTGDPAIMGGEFDENPMAVAAPRRNPSLIQRVARAVIRRDPAMGPQPLQQQTTQTGVVHPAADFNDEYFVFKTDVDRQAIYRDADEMDSESEEISTALDIISDNGTTSEDGVQISFEAHSEDTEVQQVLDDTIKSAKMKAKTKEWFRNFVKYGDWFGEPLVNGKSQIVDIRSLPPRSMFRNQDKYGNLATGKPDMSQKDGECENQPGECAFEQHESLTEKIIATFWPWQVVHARLNHDGFAVYGRSHFRVGRIVWRQLKSLVEALIIGRLTRDLLKLIFYVDTTGLAPADARAVMSQFKADLTTRKRVDMKREQSWSVLTDFYMRDGYVRLGGQNMPMRTRVEPLDPKNTGIHEITDIQFIHRKLLSSTRVPPAHMGWEQETQAGVLTQQDVQYVRWLRSVQREVSVQVLEPLFNLALILKGIDPQTAEYEIVWPALKATDEAAAAQTTLAFAQADQLYIQEGVLSPGYVQQHRFGMDEEEMDAVNQENEDLMQRDMDQFQSQQTAIAQAKGTGAPGSPAGQQQDGAPRDMDGQRKGDEGRSRDGRRIPATKSKRGVQNPTGTGTRSTRTVKAAGTIDASNALLLERLRPHFSFKAILADTTTAGLGNTDIATAKVGGQVRVTSSNKSAADTDRKRKKKRKPKNRSRSSQGGGRFDGRSSQTSDGIRH